jgi:FtsH-binding integral membrane protein
MAWQTPGSDVGIRNNTQIVADEATRTYMTAVYRWMVAGLAITGITAVGVASNAQLQQMVLGFYLPLIVGELVLVLALSFLAPKVSGPVAALMFTGYAFMTGLTFSVLFLRYSLGSIGSTFFITAGAFGALSIYGTVTKKNLSTWSTFLFMGLIGVILAGVVNIFLQSSGLSFVIACAGVLVFAGLTAYDTQKLREHHANMGHKSRGSAAITGALILYLDFINLFLMLLRLLGNRR